MNKEISYNNNIPDWVKRAGMIKQCDNLLKAEKQNYVVNTKDLPFLAMESIMLLGHVNFSINKMRRDRIKNSLQKDLHSFCEVGNPPITLLSVDELPKKTYEAKKSSKLISHPLSQLP